MRYRFTPARRRALRKAQLISAKKRKKFGFDATKRVVRKNHRAIIGVVAAGVGIGTAAYHTSKWMKETERSVLVERMKAHRRKLMSERINSMPGGSNIPKGAPLAYPGVPALPRSVRLSDMPESTQGMAYPNRETSGYRNADYIVRIKNSSSKIVKDALAAQRGQKVPVKKGTKLPQINGKSLQRKYRIQYGDYVLSPNGEKDGYGDPLWVWVPSSKVLG